MEKSIKELVSKWKETGLLDDLDDYRTKEISILLENQNSYNKMIPDGSFKNKSISMVSKIYKEFIGFELVSVQSLLGSTGLIYYNNFYEEVFTKTKKIKTEWTNDEEFIIKFREEITREILYDLRNNCATIYSSSNLNTDAIYKKIMYLSSVIHEISLSSGNDWIVTNPKIAKIMMSHISSNVIKKTENATITTIGYLDEKWKLIVDNLYPDNQILIGHYSPFNAGYFHSPHVVLYPYKNGYKNGLITQCSNKLINRGANYYGIINFKDSKCKL